MNNEVPTTGATTALTGSVSGHPQKVLVIAGDAADMAPIVDYLDDHGFHAEQARASMRGFATWPPGHRIW